MNDSTYRRARLLLGLLLVTSPLYAPALDVTGHDYEYGSTRVVAEDGQIRIVDTSELSLFYDGIDGIDCLYEYPISRPCVHEAGLLNGTRPADHPDVLDVTGSAPIHADAEYVAFVNDGPVYERTAYWEDGNYVVGLVQVSAAEALDDVATDPERVSPQTMSAIEAGSVRTDEPLSDANTIVKTEDGYFVVYEKSQSALLDANPERERLLEWVAVLFGALLLYRR